jgi:hypothetical protein
MSISQQLEKLYDMIDQANDLANKKRYQQSDEMYLKCYTIAYDLLSRYDSCFFSNEEYEFLNKILSEFEYE